MRASFALAFVGTLAFPASAQTLLETQNGNSGWQFGQALHQAADQNNDGFPDVLIGAPGANGGQGSLRCLSGKFLATLTLPVELWSLTPALNSGAGFGTSIIEVATLTGTSATDFLIGAPGYKAGLFPTGGLMLVDGATHTVATTMVGYPNTRAGTSLAAVGDQDGDGKIDVATTAPSTSGAASKVYVIRGSSFGSAGSIAASVHSSFNSNGATEFGAVVASGFDLDHDGRFDLAMGSPDFLGSGMVHVTRADGAFLVLGSHIGQQTGERFGAAIDGTRDFDGDGTNDLVVGSPNWSASGSSQNGRVSVMSGARLLSGSFPFDLYTLQFAAASAGVPNLHFGTSVRASTDLNADGVPDILVGAPGYFTSIPPLANRGAAIVFSGASGMRIASLVGAANDRLGDALLGGGIDMNGDLFPDFGVAGSLSDNPFSDCGTLKFYALFPATWNAYCTGKPNSAGCTPGMFGSGVASASSASPFTVTCANLLNQKTGLYMYSHMPKAKPFQGGFLCVRAPIRRTGPLSSGGSTSGIDCTGSFALDFNARIQSGVDPSLVLGAEVFVQTWSRDTASSSGTSLSNGLRFLINP